MIHHRGLWTTTGSMKNAVETSLTATILTNGTGLVTGGYNGAYLNSC